jgi:hypothetical protein
MAREMSERSFDELARGLAEGSISRRRALGLFASSAIAALLPSTRALADDDGFTVCHVPGRPPNCDCSRARTIRGLSRRERNRHLRNHPCDSRGNCRNNPYCGTTTTTTTSTTTSTTSTSTSTTSTSTSTTSTTTTPPPRHETICFCTDGRQRSLGCAIDCTIGDKPIAQCEAVCGGVNTVSDVGCATPGSC